MKLVRRIRTRIRCPLCGHLVWESTFLKGPYPIDVKGMACKKSLGKGHGRNTFKFYPLTGEENKPFLDRVKQFLADRIETIIQHWKLGIVDNQILKTLLTENEKLRSEIKWLKSLNVLTRDVPNSYLLTTMEQKNSYTNPKRNVTTNLHLKTTNL